MFGQTLFVGHRLWFELDLIYGNIGGAPPLQKRFQLGSPGTLRGYPQTVNLMFNHLLVSRLDFKFPLIYTSLWWDISASNLQGIIFYDQGKGWSDPKDASQARLRKNYGWGIQWMLDTLTLGERPLKIEMGYPLDDPEYDKPHFIFLSTLTW